MNVQADEQKQMQHGRVPRKETSAQTSTCRSTDQRHRFQMIHIYISVYSIYIYICIYWRAYVDILCIYIHITQTQTYIYIYYFMICHGLSWFVMICNCDASRANGNANAFSLQFLALIALNASGCMRSRGGWWTFARGSVLIILMGDSCTVYFYHLVPSCTILYHLLAHHCFCSICHTIPETIYMLFSGHPLVGKTVVIRTSQPTATVLGDVRALPRHALSETSGVARLRVAQYQRVVEARVAQAATGWVAVRGAWNVPFQTDNLN